MDRFVVSSVHGLPEGEFAYFSEREGGLPVRAISQAEFDDLDVAGEVRWWNAFERPYDDGPRRSVPEWRCLSGLQ